MLNRKCVNRKLETEGVVLDRFYCYLLVIYIVLVENFLLLIIIGNNNE